MWFVRSLVAAHLGLLVGFYVVLAARVFRQDTPSEQWGPLAGAIVAFVLLVPLPFEYCVRTLAYCPERVSDHSTYTFAANVFSFVGVVLSFVSLWKSVSCKSDRSLTSLNAVTAYLGFWACLLVCGGAVERAW